MDRLPRVGYISPECGVRAVERSLRGRYTCIVISFLVVPALLLHFTSGTCVAQNWAPDRLLVKHKKTASKAAKEKALAEADGIEVGSLPQIGFRVIKVKPGRLEEALARLANDPVIDCVERDHFGEQAAIPNDPYYLDGSQWFLPKIQAPQAWAVTTGDTNAVIALIDSGIDPRQTDLNGQLLPGFNCFDDSSDVSDLVNGHGTRVAGIAAAASNNGQGVAGVAGGSRLLPIKAIDANGIISWSDAAKAIIYAADHGARVINLSFCGTSGATVLQDAVNYAWSKGCVLIAATGNFGTDTPQYPAAYPNVIAVSATQADDGISSFSNYGSHVSLAAPGEELWTTQLGGGFAPAWGTSMATPVVAGVFALVFSANPAVSNSDAVLVVESTALDLGKKGKDAYFGYGRVDAFAAVQAALDLAGTDTTPPTASVVSPSDSSTVSGIVPIHVAATDDTGVTKVECYVDGVLRAAVANLPAQFSWDTTQSANGAHVLMTKAYDAAGNVGASASVTVFAQNPLPAVQTVIQITSPLDGSVIVGKKVKFYAEVNDPTSVRSVQLFVDGVWVKTDSKPPYKFAWKARKALAGDHTLEVVAYDNLENEISAASIVLTKP